MLAVLGKNIVPIKWGGVSTLTLDFRETSLDSPDFERQSADELKREEETADNIARDAPSLEARVLIHNLPSGLAKEVIAEAYQGAVDPSYIKEYTATASDSVAMNFDPAGTFHNAGTNTSPVPKDYTGKISYVHYVGSAQVRVMYTAEQPYESNEGEQKADDYISQPKTSEYPRIPYTTETAGYQQETYSAGTSSDNEIHLVNYERVVPEIITHPTARVDIQEEQTSSASTDNLFVVEARMYEQARPVVQERYQLQSNQAAMPAVMQETMPIRPEILYHNIDYVSPKPISAETRSIELLIPAKAEPIQPRLEERTYTSNQNVITSDNQTTEPQVISQTITEPIQSSYSKVEYFEAVQPRLESKPAATEEPLVYSNSGFDYQVKVLNIVESITTTSEDASYQSIKQPSTLLEDEFEVEFDSSSTYETLTVPREASDDMDAAKDAGHFKDRNLASEDYQSLETKIEPLEVQKERKKCLNPETKIENLERILDFKEKTREYVDNNEAKKLCAVKLDEDFDFYSVFDGPIDVREVMQEILAKSGAKYTVNLRGADGRDIAASMELDYNDALAIIYHVLVEHKGLMPDLRLQYNIDRRTEVQKGVGINFNGLLADDEGIQYVIQFVETDEDGKVIRRFNPGDSELTADQIKANPNYKLDLVRITPKDYEKKQSEASVPSKRYLGDGIFTPELHELYDEKGNAVRHAYVIEKPFRIDAEDVADGSRAAYDGLDHNLEETSVELASNHLLAIAGRKVFGENGSEVVYKKETLTLEDGQGKSRDISYIYDAKGLKDMYQEVFKQAKRANLGVYILEINPQTGRVVDESGYRDEGLQFVPEIGKHYAAVIGEGNRFDANEVVVPREFLQREEMHKI
ncbi:hypothetical protein KY360_04730 [Candidatus Woesearchaeota archaeon]|nr:hypothetical protein [Candidatus Woesearchaeota archaeon]